jgi:hypothetical protein
MTIVGRPPASRTIPCRNLGPGGTTRPLIVTRAAEPLSQFSITKHGLTTGVSDEPWSVNEIGGLTLLRHLN